jgi:FtsZ-interacting cell division protein ZipA
VPQTPLPSLDILKEDMDQWPEVQENMKKALDEMRINWDNQTKIKELQVANNPLLERRLNKKTKTDVNQKDQQQQQQQQQKQPFVLPPLPLPINETNIVNDRINELNRDASMTSTRSTPTNSRPSSPVTRL